VERKILSKHRGEREGLLGLSISVVPRRHVYVAAYFDGFTAEAFSLTRLKIQRALEKDGISFNENQDGGIG
jgi:hypothetical protein